MLNTNAQIFAGDDIVVEYNAPLYVTHPTFWDASNPSRLVAPIEGLYHITGQAAVSTTAETFSLQLIVDGSIVAQVDKTVTAPVTAADISTDYPLAVGEYVELRVFTGAGGTVTATTEYTPHLMMHRIGGPVPPAP